MKYAGKQYAIALYEAVKDNGKKETEKTIDNFLALLKEKNDLGLVGKIFTEFEKYSLKQEGILSGEIVASHRIGEEIKKNISKKIIQRLDNKKIKELNFKEKMNKELIGGFKIRVDDILIDASIEGVLNKMKRELQSSLANS